MFVDQLTGWHVPGIVLSEPIMHTKTQLKQMNHNKPSSHVLVFLLSVNCLFFALLLFCVTWNYDSGGKLRLVNRIEKGPKTDSRNLYVNGLWDPERTSDLPWSYTTNKQQKHDLNPLTPGSLFFPLFHVTFLIAKEAFPHFSWGEWVVLYTYSFTA